MTHKLSEVVKMLFQRVPIGKILSADDNNIIYYDSFSPNYLQDLMLTYYKGFSDTEMSMQISELQKQMDFNPNFRRCKGEQGDDFHVFAVLFFYASEILTFCENHVVCKYNKLLEWNELSKDIGEELAVISMLSMRDVDWGKECQNFSWSPIISHNNSQLNKILEKGMADNHFHLRGSSPYFQVGWMNLMNNPAKSQFLLGFEKIEKNYRDKNKKSEVRIVRQPMRILVAQAALIRLYLCSRLKGLQIKLTSYIIGRNDAAFFLDRCLLTKIFGDEKEVELEKCKDWLSEYQFNELWKKSFWEETQKLLINPYYLEVNMGSMQAAIECLAIETTDPDYALEFAPNQFGQGEKEYRVFAGEHWFIYSMLKKILLNDKEFTRREYNLFYAYLRIKTEVRNELIQANDMIGFENFQIYQNRKDYFSHMGGWSSEKILAKLAVSDVLSNPAMRFLEVRISPKETAAKNAEMIREYDSAVLSLNRENDILRVIEESRGNTRGEKEEALRKRFHYVLHFTKTPDVIAETSGPLECRHYEYRKKIRRRAEEILKFRKNYPQYGKRVVGIDACSQEIGCRPEVFGCVFRKLKNYWNLETDIWGTEHLPQLKITYHVGEDFLDIVDGLRAIDEAIRFLGLDCGDRLGHALALGCDAKEWYRIKGRKMTIPLHDYLDNVVWLHHNLIRYNIKAIGGLLGWLEEEYSHYFAYVYRPDLERDNVGVRGNFDINTYYLSWLLRGDDPSLYKSGRFEREELYVDQWDRNAVNKENMRSYDIRKIPEVALLYYTYHFNGEVRVKGNEKKTMSVHQNYIDGVVQVQKAMREEIVKKGIAVEMNPSSNISIGVFSGYEQHPIKTLYNLGLTVNEKELMECPQMNVSINTDDKGVFSTRLENEYALLACALENEMTPEGIVRYKKECIYKWLDNIREMGIRQTFVGDGEVRW